VRCSLRGFFGVGEMRQGKNMYLAKSALHRRAAGPPPAGGGGFKCVSPLGSLSGEINESRYKCFFDEIQT